MNIEKPCPFCSIMHSIDLSKIGEFMECACEAIFLIDSDAGTLKRLAAKALIARSYNPDDEREGILIDSGKVWDYGNDDWVMLAWTRRCPTLAEIRNGIHVEINAFLRERCGCGGQMKITGIVPMNDEREAISYACERYSVEDVEHEAGSFER